MKNLRAFKVTTIQATDTKPIRVKIQDLRHNKTIKIGYTQDSPSEESDFIEWYLKKLNINVIYKAWHEANGQQQYTIYLTDNFTDKLI